jgi:hypothetical protein
VKAGGKPSVVCVYSYMIMPVVLSPRHLLVLQEMIPLGDLLQPPNIIFVPRSSLLSDLNYLSLYSYLTILKENICVGTSEIMDYVL